MDQDDAIKEGAAWFKQTIAQENKTSTQKRTIRTLPRFPLSGFSLSNQSSKALVSEQWSQDAEPGQQAPIQSTEPPKRSSVSILDGLR